MMNRKIRVMLLGCAVMGMGVAMPSCPGQQAMQQQVDQMQTNLNNQARQIQALDAQVRNSNNEMTQAKQVLDQMANAINAQKAALETLQKSVNDLASRPAARPSAPAKKKTRGRK